MHRLLLMLVAVASSGLTVSSVGDPARDPSANDDTEPAVEARLIDGAGQAVSRIVDGQVLTLAVELSGPAQESLSFRLVLLPEGREVASCDVAAAITNCSSDPVPTLGWAWSESEERLPVRRLELRSPETSRLLLESAVAPRPAVLVHGFTASAAAWQAYIGPGGFLAGIGVAGFAVGDPELGPAMNMGRTASPTSGTGTLSQNAAVLATVIEDVKDRTGATMVDVVAHSMGGLVARYYIAKLMSDRDVAQLVLLGTPNLGSPCAVLPAALGFYLPAALELRPGYLEQVFNPQVRARGDVPVFALAGTPITERFKAPCTDVPSDLVVDIGSVAGAGAAVVELPVLHTDQTRSAQVFEEFVAPSLRRSSGSFAEAPAMVVAADSAAQSTHVYTGTVSRGATVTLDVDLDAVAVASFALFDPSRSLDVRVHGASGAEIGLSAAAHGLITIDDPASLVHLGYGFTAPRPGPWRVTLISGPATPVEGARFALSARVVGGATVEASVDEFLPAVGESVEITARLHHIAADGVEVRAVVTGPNGATSSQSMRQLGNTWRASWRAATAGVHGIDVIVTGTTLEAFGVERTVPLAVEVRADTATLWLPKMAGAVAVSLLTAGLAPRLRAYRRPADP